MNTEKKGVAPASPFSYATKQPGGDKTHRPPDTAARLRPTKQPVYFTTEQPGGDTVQENRPPRADCIPPSRPI